MEDLKNKKPKDEAGLETIIEKIQQGERIGFINLGLWMEEADRKKLWDEQGITRLQWLIGEKVKPSVVRQAQVAVNLLTIGKADDFDGITLDNLKMILPYLKEVELDRDKRIELLAMAKLMLFTDLRDELNEGKVAKHNCDDYEWIREEKVSWRCGFEGCNKRVYTDPNKKA